MVAQESAQIASNLRTDLVEQLAQLDDIKFPVHFRSHNTPRWNSQLRTLTAEYREKNHKR
ncbi:hypothetical protein [Legionella yabuuchiae]|uniref:hypothetical protein n=1 Tax=Legionella yabuuchiae TaxID=376727 RepID=UPI001054C689|nr:hypothetical protein [Legionella yabuuchiae]